MRLDESLPWTEHPFSVIDFETTGIDSATCGPCSVAVVRFERGVEVGSYYTLLNPGCPIPESATAIHGITDADVASAPALPEVAVDLYDLAKDAIPTAYNAGYDRPILHRFIAGPDCPMFDPAHLWLCGLVVIRDIDRYARGKGRHTLTAACERWGVGLDGEAHNALTDARAAGRLLVALVNSGKLVASTPTGKLLAHVEAAGARGRLCLVPRAAGDRRPRQARPVNRHDEVAAALGLGLVLLFLALGLLVALAAYDAGLLPPLVDE